MQSRTGQRENVGVRLTARQGGCETTAAAGQRCSAATCTVEAEIREASFTLSRPVSRPLSPFALRHD